MNDRAKINQPPTQSFKVEYMTAEEKAAKNMDPNTKAQVLQRDSGNNVTIYKVIRKDSDVITDLSQLEAPRPPRPGSQNQRLEQFKNPLFQAEDFLLAGSCFIA